MAFKKFNFGDNPKKGMASLSNQSTPKNKLSKDGLAAALEAATSTTPVVATPDNKDSSYGKGDKYKPGYSKPSLYLDSKDYSGVMNLKTGDTVHLAITATVKSTSLEDPGDASARIEITHIADITPGAAPAPTAKPASGTSSSAAPAMPMPMKGL